MEQLINLIAGGKPESIIVLMPRRIAITQLRADLLARFNALMGIRFLTVPDLLEILSALIGKIANPVSDVVTGEIITKIARKMRKEGKSPHLTALLSRRGSQKAAVSTLRELRQTGITSSKLRAAGSGSLIVLADLIDQFDRICSEKKIIDRAGWINWIIAALENQESILPDVDHLFVSSFNAVPPQVVLLLRQVARGKHLYLRLPSDSGRSGLFRENERLLEEATDWNTASFTSIPYEPFPEDKDPGILARKLFTVDLETLAGKSESVRFHNAPSRFDEVEAAAIKIKRKIRAGISPACIGLTMRELGPYDQFIRTIFEKFDIPYSYRRGVPILQSPPVRMAMKLAEIGKETLRYDRLLSVITSSFMPFNDRAKWQQLILGAQIFQETPQQWAERLRAHFSTDGSEPAEEAAKAAEEINRLLDLCVRLHSSYSPLDDLEALCRDYIAAAIEQSQAHDKSARRAFRDQLKQFFRIVDSVKSDLEQLRNLGVNSGVSGLELLAERLAEESIREEQDFRDAVQVLNFYDISYTSVDHLFVIGLEEGSVPHPPYVSRTLLSESNIETLKKISSRAQFLVTTADRRMSEEQSFILALSSARQSIHLYYPLHKEDGRDTSPSPYYAELQRLAGVSDEEIVAEPGGDLRLLICTPPDIHSFRRQLARQLYRTDVDVDADNALGLYNRHCLRSEEQKFVAGLHDSIEVENLRRLALFAPKEQRKGMANHWSGALQREEHKSEIEESFGNPAYEWNYNALQCFASCPFNFFLEKVLKIKMLDLPLDESNPRVTGILYHRILKKFIDSVSLPVVDPERAHSAMKDAIDEVFYSNARRGMGEELPLPLRLWLTRARDLMIGFVDHMLVEMADPSKIPSTIETEYAFGGDQCLNELVGRVVRLSGRFDRIDVFAEPGANSYRIIDYKSGSVPKLNPGLVREKQSLQLPLYILAAANLLNADIENIEASFFSLRDLKSLKLNPAEIKWKPLFLPASDENEYPGIKTVSEIVLEIIDEICTAHFPVEGRGGSSVPDPVNLVGRWLELPPELAGEGD